jgi:hypothetical protein
MDSGELRQAGSKRAGSRYSGLRCAGCGRVGDRSRATDKSLGPSAELVHTLSPPLAHSGVSLVVAALASVWANQKWKTGCFALLSFHIHLFEDMLGSRGPDGYQWPIPYLSPFSSAVQLSWHGQWALNAWPNLVITIALLLLTLGLAWWRGFSPVEMISTKADLVFVAALRKRFPRRMEV